MSVTYNEKKFVFEEKIMPLLSRYLDFCVLSVPQTLKSMASSQTLLYIRSCTFHCFSRMLSSTKMKCGQILVQLMTKVSNSSLALY